MMLMSSYRFDMVHNSSPWLTSPLPSLYLSRSLLLLRHTQICVCVRTHSYPPPPHTHAHAYTHTHTHTHTQPLTFDLWPLAALTNEHGGTLGFPISCINTHGMMYASKLTDTLCSRQGTCSHIPLQQNRWWCKSSGLDDNYTEIPTLAITSLWTRQLHMRYHTTSKSLHSVSAWSIAYY